MGAERHRGTGRERRTIEAPPPSARKPRARYRWHRLASARWGDAWEERLRALIGLDRVALTYLCGGKSLRLAACNLSRAEAARLRAHYGGRIARQLRPDWVAQTVARPEPLRIGRRLSIVRDADSRAAEQHAFPHRAVLLIPSGAAFGTGEHATTAMCLRAVERRFTMGCGSAIPERVLDVGCGSGVLGISAAALGAPYVRAFDNDPDAVRIASANADVNGVSARLKVARKDLKNWRASARPFDLIIANVFLEPLISVLPEFRRALAADGLLVISGVMRNQLADLLPAVAGARFAVHRTSSNGKWSALEMSPIPKQG